MTTTVQVLNWSFETRRTAERTERLLAASILLHEAQEKIQEARRLLDQDITEASSSRILKICGVLDAIPFSFESYVYSAADRCFGKGASGKIPFLNGQNVEAALRNFQTLMRAKNIDPNHEPQSRDAF